MGTPDEQWFHDGRSWAIGTVLLFACFGGPFSTIAAIVVWFMEGKPKLKFSFGPGER